MLRLDGTRQQRRQQLLLKPVAARALAPLSPPLSPPSPLFYPPSPPLLLLFCSLHTQRTQLLQKGKKQRSIAPAWLAVPPTNTTPSWHRSPSKSPPTHPLLVEVEVAVEVVEMGDIRASTSPHHHRSPSPRRRRRRSHTIRRRRSSPTRCRRPKATCSTSSSQSSSSRSADIPRCYRLSRCAPAHGSLGKWGKCAERVGCST